LKAIYFFDAATDTVLPAVLEASMAVNLVLAVFNLVPVPPLDGSRVMAWLLPESLREPYVALERWGILLVVALIFFVPGFRPFLGSGISVMFQAIDAMTGGAWQVLRWLPFLE
jgi:Zn-dependent protease